MKEQVAIIVPVYNSSRFLSECIESIIANYSSDRCRFRYVRI